MTNKTRKRKLLLLSWFLIALGIALAITGGVIAWRQNEANSRAEQKATHDQYAANHGYATDTNPSTVKPKPDAFSSYQVPADQPRYIFIPKINVKAIVRPTWLTSAGAIGSPTNVYDTAWYVHSARPGQPGAMLIDGHVSSWTTHGVFYNLKNLQAGDTISVERGDGQTFNYKVVETQTITSDSVDTSKLLAPINPDKPGLNLITCAGDVIKGTNEFNQRVVIYAEQT